MPGPSSAMRKIAIIGAGPAGYYTAEALAKAAPGAVEIDIIDRLPTPYGLIRAGVAPDHQSIKAVTRRYADTNALPEVEFFGNIDVGRDIMLADLMSFYDAVVLSVGAPLDRQLGIPGEALPGVHGSAAFVGWYNGHPDFADLAPELAISRAVVVGNGNVAIDVARVLLKSADAMATSDLAGHAGAAIHASPLRQVTICGRRSPLEVNFTPKELGELGRLDSVATTADRAQMPPAGAEDALEPGKRKVLQHLRSFAAAPEPAADQRHLDFAFFTRPVEILGTTCVTGLRCERTRLVDGKAHGTGDFFDIPCGLVVACIGYQSAPFGDVLLDSTTGAFQNIDGRIRDGLYCAGWARRGPTGTIGTNKPDGAQVADAILQQVAPSGKPGRAGLRAALAHLPIAALSFADWQKIDAAEIARAQTPAPRAKFTRIAELLAAARA